jgi:fucose permease
MPRPASNLQLITVSSSVIFLYGTIASLLGTLLPTLSARFQLSPEQNGYLASLQAVGLMLASLAAGALVDHFGGKNILVLGLSLILFSLFGLISASGWTAVVIAIALLGIGGGIIVSASNNMASEVDEKKRASMINLANAFFGLGGLATPFIAANLLSRDPIRLAYFVAALAAVVLLGCMLMGRPPSSRQRSFHFADVARLEGKPLLLLLCSMNFLYIACEIGFWNWLPKYFVNVGIPQRTALNILGFGFACGIIAGRLVGMPILARVSASVVALAAGVFMIVTTYATIHTSSAAVASVCVFLAGMAMGPVFPGIMAMTADAFPRMRATCMGIVITCGWLGAVVSSWAIGNIAGIDPRRLPTGLMIIPVSSVVMVLLGFVISRKLRRAEMLTATV